MNEKTEQKSINRNGKWKDEERGGRRETDSKKSTVVVGKLEELKDVGMSLRASETALGSEDGKASDGKTEKGTEFGGSEIPTKKSVKLFSHGEMG